MGRRKTLVSVALAGIFLIVAGLIFVQATGGNRNYRTVYRTIHEISAGTLLTSENVEPIPMPVSNDDINLLSSDPRGSKRAGHQIDSHSPLRSDDVIAANSKVEVPINIKGSVKVGDTIDLFYLDGTKMLLIAKNIPLVSSGVALVPVSQEIDWITLAANGVTLYASKGTGLDLNPPTDGVGVSDAISQLSGSASSGPPK
jgi:hypothetical protein